MRKIKDNFQRTIDYMRISITDRCNLRCIYCMPFEDMNLIERKEILSYEEILRVVRVAAGIGLRKIRITGGEPLARKNVTYLIASIKNIEGIEDLSLTTNGVLLERFAKELADAGLDRVNISLDSFRPDKYREITRGGDIDVVLRGIASAEMAGLRPIKINVVPIRGFNDDEIEEFAKITLKASYQVRFIEFMPFGVKGIEWPEKYISSDEIKSIVEGIGPLTPVKIRKSGPARYFRFDNAPGIVGFISPISHHFCEECNRLRLTADGKLRPCLFSETEIDLKLALRGSLPDNEIERLIKLSIEVKPEGHTIRSQESEVRSQNENTHHSSLITHHFLRRPMSKIGG
ncbi:MAG: GTP 3',8-cyclase MoaA [Nitrospirota bacterium]